MVKGLSVLQNRETAQECPRICQSRAPRMAFCAVIHKAHVLKSPEGLKGPLHCRCMESLRLGKTSEVKSSHFTPTDMTPMKFSYRLGSGASWAEQHQGLGKAAPVESKSYQESLSQMQNSAELSATSWLAASALTPVWPDLLMFGECFFEKSLHLLLSSVTLWTPAFTLSSLSNSVFFTYASSFPFSFLIFQLLASALGRSFGLGFFLFGWFFFLLWFCEDMKANAWEVYT